VHLVGFIIRRLCHSISKFSWFPTSHVETSKFCEKWTVVSIHICKLCVSPETFTVLSGDACLDFVQSMVANWEATLSNACHRNAGTTKTFSLTTFRYRSLLAGEKILSISSGTGIHVLFLWQYPSLRIFLLAAIWILKVATAIVIKETSSFPVIEKDVKKVIWLLWIKKKLYCEAFWSLYSCFSTLLYFVQGEERYKTALG